MGEIDYFSIQRVLEYFPQLLSRLHITIFIAVASFGLGLLLGTIIAAFRLFNIPLMKMLTSVYISFVRAVPINIQLFIVYFGLPVLFNPLFIVFGLDLNSLNPIYFVIMTYAFSSAAYLAIVISASINGVDIGQTEAALSIGMTRFQLFRRVISPQAFQISVPELGNIAITTLKNTSLAFTVGVMDSVGVISSIAARTKHSLEGYVCVAIIYLVLCLLLEKLFSFYEKKYKVIR